MGNNIKANNIYIMKKNVFNIMKQFLFIVLIIGIISCSKENSDNFLPDPTNPINDTVWSSITFSNDVVNTLPSDLATNELIDSFSNTTGRIINYTDSLEVNIPANSFSASNGTTITGNANLLVHHLKKKGDFIRFARPTTTNHLLLESSSGFLIRATQNSQDLSLTQGKILKVKFKNNNPSTLNKVYYGEENVTPNTSFPFDFTWKLNSDNSEINIVYTQAPNLYKGYELNAKKIRWVAGFTSIDTSLPKTIVNVILNPNFTNKNTAVYAVYKDLNTVVRLSPNYSSRSFYAINMLLNKNIYLISISKIGNKYYLASSEATITHGLSVKLNSELKTLSQIKDYLDLL